MNTSILSLSLVGQYQSSLFTKSSHTGTSTSAFEKISISKSFSPFFYSIPSNSHLKFKNSHFSKFLDTAVIIDKQQIYRSREVISFIQDSNFDCVKFTDITHLDSQGGALCVFSPINLTGTQFVKCSAQKGGSIAAYSDLILNYVTVSDSKAQFGAGGLIHVSGIGNLTFNNTVFFRTESNYYGAIYTKSLGAKKFFSSNLTEPHATECVGAMELTDGIFEFKYFNIYKSKANAHNGAFCIRTVSVFQGSHSLFMESFHGSEYTTTGASLIVYGSPYDAKISETYFVRNMMAKSYDIFIDNGNPVSFINCRFTHPKNKEFSPSNVRPVDIDCTFEDPDIVIPKEYLNLNAGKTQMPVSINIEPSNQEIVPAKTHVLNAVIAALIAFVGSFLITFIQRKGCKSLKCTKSQREVV